MALKKALRKTFFLMMMWGALVSALIGGNNVPGDRETYLKKDNGLWFKVIREEGKIVYRELTGPPSAVSMNTVDVPYDFVSASGDLYQPYQAIDVGSWPEAVAIGDVNNDNRKDVVMTTTFYSDPANDRCLFVFLQNSSGTLNAPIKYRLDPDGRAESVSIGDINNDGLSDVVVGNHGRNLEILYQNASGTLEPGIYYNSTDTLSIKIGDFNGDGRGDVAGIGWGTNTAAVWLQNTAGTLNPPVTYSVTHGGYDELDAGDVNNDGLTDLVVMSGQGYTPPNIGVLLQDPTGGFSAPVYYDLGGNELTRGVAVGDVTGDYRADITVSYGGNRPSSHIGVFPQNNNGTLDPAVVYTAYDCPEPVVTGDTDNDARNDVIVAHGGWNSLSIYAQDSSGDLLPYQSYPLPYASHYNPQGLDAGDINSDGALDIVLADYNHGLVVLYHKPATTVTVTSPNGGESWQVGSPQTITWTSVGAVFNVKIEYSTNNGSNWTSITASTPNDGAYPWIVPGVVSGQCLIRVKDTHGIPSDTSDAVFSIVPVPAVTVTSPNGGESWEVGSLQTITWTSVGTVGNVKIEYSANNGGDWAAIIASTENDGTHPWIVPYTVSSQCLVRVSETGGSPSDTSDNVFSIFAIPGITVTSPNGGESWQTGAVYDITWVSIELDGDIIIDLYKGGIFDSNIGTASVSSGSFPWDIPLDLTPADDYRVRIHQGDVEDYSDINFSLLAKTPFLSAPDFNRDGQADVIWRYHGQGGYNAVWLIGTTNDNVTTAHAVEFESIKTNMNFKTGGKKVKDKIWETLKTSNIKDGFAGVPNGNQKAMPALNQLLSCEIEPSVADPGDDPQAVELLAVEDLDWQLCGTGDFNFDGKIDIVWSHVGDGRNCVWYMDGVTFCGYEAFPDGANLDWKLSGVEDFNLDGKPDLLWRNEADGRNAVWYMDGTTLLSIGIMTTGANLDWELCGTGDFNNDGKADLVWRNVVDGRNAVWYMDGAELVSVEFLLPVEDLNWKLRGTGDFNNDGKTDLIWTRISDGCNCITYFDGVILTGGEFLTTVTDTTWKIEN
jgi:hypothetical protein